jgi:hypothetical protein
MRKQTYLAILMCQSPDWIIGSMRNPSPSMRPVHVALHAIALRRLGISF